MHAYGPFTTFAELIKTSDHQAGMRNSVTSISSNVVVLRASAKKYTIAPAVVNIRTLDHSISAASTAHGQNERFVLHCVFSIHRSQNLQGIETWMTNFPRPAVAL